MVIIQRAYADKSDIPHLVALLHADEMLDRHRQELLCLEVERELHTSSLDLAHDLRLWENDQEAVIGFARVWIPDGAESLEVSLEMMVDAMQASPDILSQMISWAESRLREVGRERKTLIKLFSRVEQDDTVRRTLLERHGFHLIRRFLTMQCSLEDPVAAPVLPAGFTVREVEGKEDEEAWIAMYNESFIDHWDYHPLTSEQFREVGADPAYQSSLDLVALAPDGTLVAFCYASIDPEENRRQSTTNGWLVVLGTRRGYRKLGLGRAMLRCGMRALQTAGMSKAYLNVDADNESGAVRLYQSEGFRQGDGYAFYGKELSCPH